MTKENKSLCAYVIHKQNLVDVASTVELWLATYHLYETFVQNSLSLFVLLFGVPKENKTCLFH